MTCTIIGSYSFIEKTLEKYQDKNSEIEKFDLEESSFDDVLISLNTYSLFTSKRQIIVNNIELLNEDTKLEKYLENEGEYDLFLISLKKLDERKKITKLLKKHTKWIEEEKDEFKKYLKEELKDYKIDYYAFEYLKEACNNDYLKAFNEIEKLKQYKINEKEITEEDVKLLVTKSLNDTIFDLINTIVAKNVKKQNEIYHALIRNKEDPIKILIMLANHYRLIYQVKVKRKTMKDFEVIKDLKLNPYRFEKLKEASYKYSEEDLLDILKIFSKTDEDIKTGRLEKTFATEVCLIKVASK